MNTVNNICDSSKREREFFAYMLLHIPNLHARDQYVRLDIDKMCSISYYRTYLVLNVLLHSSPLFLVKISTIFMTHDYFYSWFCIEFITRKNHT